MDVKNALELVKTHVLKHSNNKYQNTILDTESPLKEPKFTLLTANTYMARYLATDGEKRANIEDLAKAVHFILFEIQNRLNIKEAMDFQPRAGKQCGCKTCRPEECINNVEVNKCKCTAIYICEEHRAQSRVTHKQTI